MKGYLNDIMIIFGNTEVVEMLSKLLMHIK